MTIVNRRGEMWARNDDAIRQIPGSSAGGRGVYILFDGSTPVYVGKGNIRQRVRKARASKRRGQWWDHFSWYIVPNDEYQRELEALLLRMLPPFLRILTRQRGKLPGAVKHPTPKNIKPDPIKRPHLLSSARAKA
jgi:hypothetical protein